MKRIFFTLTGTNHYYGTDFLKKGMKIRLKKEPDNEHDKEKEGITMKGYYTSAGFYGLIDGIYVLFSGEAEYYEYMEEEMAS